eukprot:1145313-Pelagomonas_calceolata.AAC.2
MLARPCPHPETPRSHSTLTSVVLGRPCHHPVALVQTRPALDTPEPGVPLAPSSPGPLPLPASGRGRGRHAAARSSGLRCCSCGNGYCCGWCVGPVSLSPPPKRGRPSDEVRVGVLGPHLGSGCWLGLRSARCWRAEDACACLCPRPTGRWWLRLWKGGDAAGGRCCGCSCRGHRRAQCWCAGGWLLRLTWAFGLGAARRDCLGTGYCLGWPCYRGLPYCSHQVPWGCWALHVCAHQAPGMPADAGSLASREHAEKLGARDAREAALKLMGVAVEGRWEGDQWIGLWCRSGWWAAAAAAGDGAQDERGGGRRRMLEQRLMVGWWFDGAALEASGTDSEGSAQCTALVGCRELLQRWSAGQDPLGASVASPTLTRTAGLALGGTPASMTRRSATAPALLVFAAAAALVLVTQPLRPSLKTKACAWACVTAGVQPALGLCRIACVGPAAPAAVATVHMCVVQSWSPCAGKRAAAPRVKTAASLAHCSQRTWLAHPAAAAAQGPTVCVV